MRLTVYTDYGFRLLIYVGLKKDALCTIQDVANAYGISKNHLMKVAYHLGRHGFIETVRGRNGGLRLARPASDIKLGDVVRALEDDLTMVECFAPQTNQCQIARVCGLRGVLGEALAAYMAVLDRQSLADLLRRTAPLEKILLSA